MSATVLQARLAAAGFDPGPVDGDLGPHTYAALLGYVADRQLGDVGLQLGQGMKQWWLGGTGLPLCHFLGQTCEESTGYRDMQERGGPAYFKRLYDIQGERPAKARELGNLAPGDGPRFHGRGLIQLTGRANYAKAAVETGLDLIADPDLAAQPAHAVRLAVLYWTDHHLDALADADDIEAITRKINGGVNGLADRKAATSRAKTRLL